MAYTFCKLVQGIILSKSLYKTEWEPIAQALDKEEQTGVKILIPVDAVITGSLAISITCLISSVLTILTARQTRPIGGHSIRLPYACGTKKGPCAAVALVLVNSRRSMQPVTPNKFLKAMHKQSSVRAILAKDASGNPLASVERLQDESYRSLERRALRHFGEKGFYPIDQPSRRGQTTQTWIVRAMKKPSILHIICRFLVSLFTQTTITK